MIIGGNGVMSEGLNMHDVGEAGSKVTMSYVTDFEGVEVDIEEPWEEMINEGMEGVECEEVESGGLWSEGEDMVWAMFEREGVNVVVWRRTSIVEAGAVAEEIMEAGAVAEEIMEAVAPVEEIMQERGGDHGNEVGELCLVG